MSDKKRELCFFSSCSAYLRNIIPEKSKVFEAYDRIRQFYIIHQVIEFFDKRLDDPAPLLERRVLDLGCGLSRVGEFLVLSGADVTSVDIDREILSDAKLIAQKYGTDITFVQGKIEDFIHATGEYDVILCLDLIEYISDVDKFVWVVEKILSDDGIVVFSCVNKGFLSWFLHIFLSSYILKRTPRGSRKYKYFYTPEMLGHILAKAGLEIVRQQGMSFSFVEKEWRLSQSIKTRYLVTVRKSHKN